MSEFRMPSLGADMEAGTLVEWMRQPGDRVQRGDAIAAVETQKGAIEIESFDSGVLEDIRVQVGERVPVGTVLATIRVEGEGRLEAPAGAQAEAQAEAQGVGQGERPGGGSGSGQREGGEDRAPTAAVTSPAPAPAALAPVAHAPVEKASPDAWPRSLGAEAAAMTPAPSAATAPAAEAMQPVPAAAPTPPAVSVAARITPAALRRAQELGLDLASLRPAADGVIGLREVDAARASTLATGAGAPRRATQVPAAAMPPPATVSTPPSPLPSPFPAAAPAPSPVAARAGLDLDEMRRAIAAAMARSWREIPHYFVTSTVDLSPMLAWLERGNARRAVPERLHYAVPLIKAVALSLKAVPVLNGHYGERGFEPSASVHLGIAIAMRGGGLIAPAILDADTLALAGVMAALDDLVARVRGGRLRSSEMTAGTATLTNLGEGTADAVQPVIYPPQVAIIGCGQILERAWAHDGALSVRRAMTVTVGGDHRVSDGRAAAKFLTHLADLLQHPERL